MDESFFSDSILEFINDEEDEEEFENIDYLFGQIPDEVFTAVVDSASSERTAEPRLSSCSEFKRTNSGELQRLIEKNRNENTKRSTNTWVKRYQKWAEERGFEANIAQVPKSELDGILQQFYAELMKCDGEEYEPESLKVMQAALDRRLREEGCSYSILKDADFSNSRKVLNGKAIVLQEKGKGKRPRKADPLTEKEEEHLWNSGVLGTSNPTSLNYTVFFLFSQHFGTRGRQEHHQLHIEDLKTVRDATTGHISHIEWVEGPTKTRQGGLHKKARPVVQKLMRTGGPRCPVSCFEALISKRPAEMQAHGLLYLVPLRKERDWPKAKVWFSRQAVGVNGINQFMKNIAKEGELDVTSKNFTNHSVRKTTVKKLKKAGASSRDIMAITGHRNEQSLADYDDLDLDDHLHLGEILSGKKHSSNALVAANHHQPVSSLSPNPVSTTFPQAPMVFNNCNVTFGSTTFTSFSQSQSSYDHSQSRSSHHQRKRPCIIYSDSDSD